MDVQKRVLKNICREWHKEYEKTAFLHQRDAFDDFVSILHQIFNSNQWDCSLLYGKQRKVRTVLDMGMYVGVTGWFVIPRGVLIYVKACSVYSVGQVDDRDGCSRIPARYATKTTKEENEPAFLSHISQKMLNSKDFRR